MASTLDEKLEEKRRLDAWIAGYEQCLKDHKIEKDKTPPVVDLRDMKDGYIKAPDPVPNSPNPFTPYGGLGIPLTPLQPLVPTPRIFPYSPGPIDPGIFPQPSIVPKRDPDNPRPDPPFTPPYTPAPFTPPYKPHPPFDPWNTHPRRRRCPRCGNYHHPDCGCPIRIGDPPYKHYYPWYGDPLPRRPRWVQPHLRIQGKKR